MSPFTPPSKVNPMLGLRGCRLGITIPELVEMQVRALPCPTLSLTLTPP